MFNIEFMTGAMILASIKLAIFLVFVYMVYRVGKKFYDYSISEDEEKSVNVKWELSFLFLAIVISTFMGSAGQPKIALEVPVNRDLIEYQSNTDDIVIETPAPRSEKLDGFSPLKKE